MQIEKDGAHRLQVCQQGQRRKLTLRYQGQLQEILPALAPPVGLAYPLYEKK